MPDIGLGLIAAPIPVLCLLQLGDCWPDKGPLLQMSISLPNSIKRCRNSMPLSDFLPMPGMCTSARPGSIWAGRARCWASLGQASGSAARATP